MHADGADHSRKIRVVHGRTSESAPVCRPGARYTGYKYLSRLAKLAAPSRSANMRFSPRQPRARQSEAERCVIAAQAPEIARPNIPSELSVKETLPQLADIGDKKANTSVQMADKLNSHRLLAVVERIHKYNLV